MPSVDAICDSQQLHGGLDHATCEQGNTTVPVPYELGSGVGRLLHYNKNI